MHRPQGSAGSWGKGGGERKRHSKIVPRSHLKKQSREKCKAKMRKALLTVPGLGAVYRASLDRLVLLECLRTCKQRGRPEANNERRARLVTEKGYTVRALRFRCIGCGQASAGEKGRYHLQGIKHGLRSSRSLRREEEKKMAATVMEST